MAYSWLVDSIRACYRLTGNDSEWLEGVTTALLRGIRNENRAVSCFFHLGPSGLHPRRFVIKGCSVDHINTFLDVCVAPSLQWSQQLHREVGWCWSWHEQGLLESCSDVSGQVADYLSLWAADIDGTGCVFLFPTSTLRSVAHKRWRMWEDITAHIALGYWLRRRARDALAHAGNHGSGPPAGCTPTSMADERAATNAADWPTLANALDQAYGRTGPSGTQIAAEVWEGLLSGQWVLLGHWEQEGRRYLLVHQNPSIGCQSLALTPRERQAIQLALDAFGNRHYRDIAEQIHRAQHGEPGSENAQAPKDHANTVGNQLRAAMGKVGVGHRAELVSVFAPLAQAARR